MSSNLRCKLFNAAKVRRFGCVWKTWCEGKSIALEIEEHEPAEQNRLLEKFYAEVKNKYDLQALSPRESFSCLGAGAISAF